MPSHIFVRLGLWDEAIASNWKSYEAGVEYARSIGLSGATREELHALDYAVYGYLQRGEDSAARAAADSAAQITMADSRAVIGGYNRPRWRRGFRSSGATGRRPRRCRSRTTPGPCRGGARTLHPRDRKGTGRAGRGGRAEVAALDTIATALDARKEPYWARVVRIKRDAADAWVRFAAGDTAGALALSAAAADTEEVTDKHPITPAELLPARELQADMLLAAGRAGRPARPIRPRWRANGAGRGARSARRVPRSSPATRDRRRRGIPGVPAADEQGGRRAGGDRRGQEVRRSHLIG